ncbi:melatonin receptor type 1B-A-like [Watersipora subatra]|uniref:melatonin receptor type 1B-A-like n=1 Tax=Watersipora subatra TaxID=2589382 RepID=UPI00355BF97A
MGNNATIEYNPREGLDNLPQGFRTFCIVFQSLLSLTGTLGNLLTLVAVFSCKKLRRTHNAYIAHLAFVDLLISGFLVPTNIYGLSQEKMQDDSISCKVVGIISLAALVASILSLFMVALNRYVLICKGMQTYIKMYNKMTIPISIGLIWVWAFAVVLPMLTFNGIGWSIKTHYCFFINYDFITFIYICVGLAQAGVIIPAAGTSICYLLIIKKLKATALKLAPKSGSSAAKEAMTPSSSSNGGHEISQLPTATDMSSFDEEDIDEQEQLESKIEHTNNKNKLQVPHFNAQLKRQRAKQRAHNRRVLGLIAIFTIFMICWLPIAVTFTIDYKQQLPGLVYVALISVAWINSSINVFLYAFTNQTYRQAFTCLLKCRFSEINSNFLPK